MRSGESTGGMETALWVSERFAKESAFNINIPDQCAVKGNHG